MPLNFGGKLHFSLDDNCNGRTRSFRLNSMVYGVKCKEKQENWFI
jgi:hypothetical protein